MDFDSELELHTSDGNTGSALRLGLYESATGAAQAGQAQAAARTRSRSPFNCEIEVIRDDSAADTVTASAVTVTVTLPRMPPLDQAAQRTPNHGRTP